LLRLIARMAWNIELLGEATTIFMCLSGGFVNIGLCLFVIRRKTTFNVLKQHLFDIPAFSGW